MSMFISPSPVDVTRHLSSETRLRQANPMKAIGRMAKRKADMISLANGDPHFSLYPLRRVEFELAALKAVEERLPERLKFLMPGTSWRLGGPKAHSQIFTTTIDSSGAGLPLKAAMQYTSGAGLPEAQRAVTELTNYYHSPPDHVATLTVGNADGVAKIFRLLGDHGDHFLADEFSFSALTNVPLAHGVKWVPVKLDEGGIIPEVLEGILSNWDEASQGRRPHVLYTVPCGQNPTGSTLSLARRRKIYELAQRFDIIIIEDDPYYYLQYDLRDMDSMMTDAPFKFTPSFLSMDVDGRVMRVDSFSKIMAPGMRLGWITSNPEFQDHLLSLTDSSTQHPHAFGQIFITEMLLSPSGWQVAGFDRWVRSLRLEYQRRRDFFMRAFLRDVASTGLASAEYPEAGMFVWIRIHVEKHPRYRRGPVQRSSSGSLVRTNVSQLMDELFERCLDRGVLVMPASVFVTSADSKVCDIEDPIEDRVNFLRTTYAGPEDKMEPGLRILAQVLKEFFVGSK